MARSGQVCYRVLALVTFVLGIGALVCAGVGYGNYRNASTDLPFYVGGLIVAPLALVAVALALMKSCREPNYDPTCCDKCLAKTWWLVVGFLVAGCIVGIVFVGVGGLSADQTNTAVRAISVVMMICFVSLIAIWALATCLNWCCDKTANNKVSDHHRPARDLDHSVPQSSRSSNLPAPNITIINTDTSQPQIADLQRQNRLMQQQINQQQQLITQQLEAQGTLMDGLRQQQQQQQQHQQRNPDGEPPPPYKSVV